MAIAIVTDWTILTNEGAASSTVALPSLSAPSGGILEILIVTYNGSGTASISTTVSANGQSASLVDGYTAAQTRLAIGVYQFLESQIADISTQTLTTSGATGTQKSVFYRLLSGAKQSVPTAVGKAHAIANGSQAISLTRDADSFTTAVSFCSAINTSITTGNPVRDAFLSLTSGRRLSYGSEPDTANTSDTTITAVQYSATVAYNRESAPSQSILSVNGGSGLVAGSTGNTAQLAGFISPPTGGNAGGVAFTNFSYNAGTQVATFDLSSYSDGSTWPNFDGNVTVTITDGTNSPILGGVPLDPPAGWAVVDITTPNTSDSTYIGRWADLVDYEIAYDTESGIIEIGSDGGVIKGVEGLHTMYKRNQTTGLVTQLNVTMNNAGEITNVTRGLAAIGLSSAGLASIGLSSVGL